MRHTTAKQLAIACIAAAIVVAFVGCKTSSYDAEPDERSRTLEVTTLGDLPPIDLTRITSASRADIDGMQEQYIRLYNQSFLDSQLAAAADFLRALPADSPLKRLSTFEIVAIQAYTGRAYLELNRLLRNRDREGLREWAGFVIVAAAGLNKLPRHAGIVERIIRLDEQAVLERVMCTYDAATKNRRIVTEASFVSTTAGTVEDAGFSGNIKYRIKSLRGRRIEWLSPLPHEREVLFSPGSDFKVTEVRRATNLRDVNCAAVLANPKPSAPAHAPSPDPMPASTNDSADRPTLAERFAISYPIGIDPALDAPFVALDPARDKSDIPTFSLGVNEEDATVISMEEVEGK